MMRTNKQVTNKKQHTMAREKKKVIANVTREQAEDAMAIFADAANSLGTIEAEMNGKINSIRDKYQDKITGFKEQKDAQVEVLEVFATETHDQWGKKKSMELLHGVIGFRTGTPKVKFEKGFNSKSVTAILQEKYPDYVRTVTEMDKEKLISERDADGFEMLCKKAHIEVVQDETFYVESKTEALQPA
jgi:phage host-nuclease inhibitor protein Gam